MNPCFSLGLLVFSGFFAGSSACALESRLPYAAGLPEPDEQSVQTLAYIQASHVGSTLLQRIESDSFALELNNREKRIAALAGASDRVLPDLQHLLVTEGFDAFNILSSSPTPRFKTRLKHSVCVVLQTKKKQPKLRRPILVSFRLSDTKTTASAFGLAKLFEDFQIEAETPIWICARSDNPTATEELAGKKRFSAHILLNGTSPNAFINYLGRETTRLLFRERAWDWIREDANTARNAAEQVLQTLSQVKSRWDTDKSSPWTRTDFSPIQCKKSFISSVRNTCWFDVTVTSRSQVALSERSQMLLRLALNETQKINRRLASPKKKPAVTLSLPKNNHVKPIAGNPEKLSVLSAWRAALTEEKGKHAFLSSRFTEPQVVGNKAQAIPLLTLSAIGSTKDDTTHNLSVLAKTLLLVSETKLQ